MMTILTPAGKGVERIHAVQAGTFREGNECRACKMYRLRATLFYEL